jgi:hypothetical protein
MAAQQGLMSMAASPNQMQKATKTKKIRQSLPHLQCVAWHLLNMPAGPWMLPRPTLDAKTL